MRKVCLFVTCGITLLVTGCRSSNSLPQLEREFVDQTLAFSPVSATAAGLHRYDHLLDDTSPASIERQKQFYRDFRDRLKRVTGVSAEDRADYQILEGQITLALLELEQIQGYKHNPTQYVELIGNALFSLYVLDYAPLPQRMASITSRVAAIPAFLTQARQNLVSSPAIWTQVAQEENAGNIQLIDKTIRAAVPAGQHNAYDRAAAPALQALNEFQEYLRGDLTRRNSWDWRLGRDLYTRKFRAVMDIADGPDELLAKAEAELPKVRARMLALGTEGMAERVAGRHSTRESYVADARADLDEARRFVQEQHLLTLPPRANLQVIETPEFMRGVYAVGGFNPAPPLEPRLGAFYWITPIPADWPAARVESKLREYNFYKLKLLTIHEAMPGHYVQLEYANDVQPESRRLLRSLYGNGPYIEGWGQYAEQLLIDSGFLDHAPELQFTFLKEELRVLANAILDIRLQMHGMTDQEALDLMQKQTFQEAEEATAKLQRAKLTSAQLPTYYAGWRAWLEIRERARAAQGSAFRLADFNDRALREGSVPLSTLAGLLGL
jgi:uncharacterized protein (DUF885 family)